MLRRGTVALAPTLRRLASSDGFMPRRQRHLNLILNIVPHQENWILETLGKFKKVLKPGWHLLMPIVSKIAYKHSLKQVAVEVADQRAITKDNVQLRVGGVLYYQIFDPEHASYNVEDVHFALRKLAESTMRAELGQMTLDRTFAERNVLNVNIVNAINAAANEWGVSCKRYEIRDITPPDSVMHAMELQSQAERQKRAAILKSEGEKQADINSAEGKRQAMILRSEGQMTELINTAKGQADAIVAQARATAQSIVQLAQAVREPGGTEAVSLRIAEQYVQAFSQLAKETNTVLLPSSSGDVATMVASALTVFDKISSQSAARSGAARSSKSDAERTPISAPAASSVASPLSLASAVTPAPQSASSAGEADAAAKPAPAAAAPRFFISPAPGAREYPSGQSA